LRRRNDAWFRAQRGASGMKLQHSRAVRSLLAIGGLLLATCTPGCKLSSGPASTSKGSTALAPRGVVEVGPGKKFDRPSAAARVAKNGDVIEIAAGTYEGDVAIWRQNNLTIRGVGGRPHLEADGEYAEGKGIWVIKGRNATVENVEFSGARVPDQNGAGIRQE
jgi:hypothetical protein